MIGRTHDAAAFATLITVVVIVQPTNINVATALAAVFANQVGGIAPDIDQPTAPFWRNLPIGSFFGRIFGSLLGGHRFLSHSLIGVALFGFIAHWLLAWLQPIMPHIDTDIVWAAFIIGFISHLVTDSLTREGVPWLLPIPVKFGISPLKRMRLVTGGKIESLIVLPLLLVVSIWLCSNFYEIIRAAITKQS